MPSSKHFFHKNRSQASLLNIQDHNDRRPYQASQFDSPLHSPAFSPHSVTSTSASPSGPISASPSPHYDNEDYRYGPPNHSDESRFYQAGLPSRSQSQRTPPAHYVHPSIQLVGPPQGGIVPIAIEDNPDSYYQQGPPPSAPKEDRRRRFFGLGSSSATKEPANNNGGQRLGRNISVRKKPLHISTDSNNRPIQHRWSASVAPPTSEEEEGGGAGLDPSHLQPGAHSIAPPIPEKDPSRLSHFPLPQQDPPGRGASLSSVVTNHNIRQPLERQESSNSLVWENTVRQHYRSQTETQFHHPPSYQPSPSSATSTSGPPLLPPGPAESLQQYYQGQSSRPSSQHSIGPPSPIQPTYRGSENPPNRASLNLGPTSAYTSPPMGPPSQQQPQGRGSNELPPQNPPVGLAREGSGYQPYAQNAGHTQAPGGPQYGGQLGVNTQGGSYRGVPQPSPMVPQPSTDTGRSTPPPSRSRDDLAGLDIGQLVSRHDELQDKYRKVKKYYFDKDAQVQQLQNTLAHQRLSQSRTSLDDNEYGNRFSRLDGAINNLSFNIRRDWRAVPPWLAPSVNRDAPSNPTKEMTAVGRACISRWLVDELLDRYFHPALDPSLSAHLKIIEKNLRRYAAPTPSEEERDALMARISNWRLATIDGLQDMLNSPQATEYKSSLTDLLVEKLTASLSMSLKDPPPPGLEGGVAMIVELAVGIAANLPLESRDVFVDYIAPGTLVNETFMKIESGLPPLMHPGEGLVDNGSGEKASDDSGSAELKDVGQGELESGPPVGSGGAVPSVVTTKEQKKKSMFGGLMSSGKKGGGGSAGPAQQQQQQPQPPQPPKEEKVRFAAFMAVEVRGRSVLVKAPVYV